MYNIKQSMTTHYNPKGNSICERFNCTQINHIKTLPTEQKVNWPLHIPSLVFTYNVTSHNITGYQPYELMFGCKVHTVRDAWLGLASYDDKASAIMCAWLNKQH